MRIVSRIFKLSFSQPCDGEMVNHEAQSSAGAGNLSVKLDKLCGEYMNSVD